MFLYGGAVQVRRRAARSASGTATSMRFLSASIVTTSPSRTRASGPPSWASGVTWPTIKPWLPPLNRPLARALVQRTRVAKLLAGYRDVPAVDEPALLDTLTAVSQLLAELPELAELDINPLLASADGVAGLDDGGELVRARLRQQGLGVDAHAGHLRQHQRLGVFGLAFGRIAVIDRGEQLLPGPAVRTGHRRRRLLGARRTAGGGLEHLGEFLVRRRRRQAQARTQA